MTTNFSQTAAYIWSLADLLRGDFKQSQYGRVILPFTILRRLECVLESRKPKVLEQVEKLRAMIQLEEGGFWLMKSWEEQFKKHIGSITKAKWNLKGWGPKQVNAWGLFLAKRLASDTAVK